MYIAFSRSHFTFEKDGDDEQITHRIPHRFEPLTNIGANWCCHCGYMLPLGRKNARKCSECDITCHANCAHLVPDLCGMSLQMLQNWHTINKARSVAKGSAPRPSQVTSQYPASPSSTTDSFAQIGGSMDRMRLSGSPEYTPSQDRPTPDPRYLQQQAQPPSPTTYSVPQGLPPGARPPPGARIPIPPGYSQDRLISTQQGRPYDQVWMRSPGNCAIYSCF
jgi:hypothetical protein